MKQIRNVIVVLSVVSAFIFVISMILLNIRSPYREVIVIEAGQNVPDASYFFENLDRGAKYETDISKISTNHVGTYELKIKLKGLVYKVTLEVKDTKTPELELFNQYFTWVGEVAQARDVVKKCVDETTVTYRFERNPDFNREGEYIVTVIATDEGGNSTSGVTVLKVGYDTEPPAIYGVRDRLIGLNDKIVYRDEVYVADNSGRVELSIDSSKVDVTKEGVYPVVYTATDCYGNTTNVTVNFTVKYIEKDKPSKEEMDAYFKQVYHSIVKDNMTKPEIVEAVYYYIHNSFAFIPTSDQSDWEYNAYTGLLTMQGDCYTYYAIARKMFEYAGIENMCVERKNKGHYWNLVNCGNGWYHFDVMMWDEKLGPCIMWTDKDIEDFSKRANSNWFDTEENMYPKTPVK